MADRQRKVSLIFEANTNQAKQNINDLVQSLQKIQSMPSSLIDPTGIKEASKAAMELQGHIQKAINIDTGKLDLSRFAASLSTSGKSLEQYRATLTRIGPEGTAAFKSVISSINNAEVSTVRLTKGMKDFLVTMKNTVKWQISSSIMHELIGGMESAYGYAKSLDASLNNIRIVTGQTSDQMARFAVEANRAAQALSTTTTKYTDAALIFYQQGLNDKVVKERTDTVIKMANITGETAKDVSSYMTAIWNNFDDGSKSLEYYADVITKLGAATAASSEEIAGGLEKFAAIGNTIGLSYEYATSMITTIVDKTRQSEDVVGTALKTILARIQGLNLGETLDDGTTLNKYSGALEKVGINIKDASGQLKDMDIILDELGSKWNTFSKDTQIALAQVVGGVRQYNQIIALMDNWSSFQKNVQIAETSTGSLNEQANIYAEGWEAARDRVRAAAEGIYDALINEDVFIKLDDIFTHLLNGINGVVKGMGGMVPILGTIGGIVATKIGKETPAYLNNLKQNLAFFSGKANKDALDTQREATVSAERMRDLSAGDARTEAEYESLRRISLMREKLVENQHRMSSAEIEQYQTIIKNEEALGRIMIERQAAVGLIEKETQALKEQVALRTTQIQIENAKHDFTDDGSDEEYKTSKVWDTTQALERQKLEKQLLDDENRRSELMKAQLGEGKTKKEREKTRRALTSEEKIELQDIERRLNKYGIEGQRTDEYYNEIYTRTSRKYKGMTKEAATKVVDAASIKKQKQLMTQEFKSLLNGEQFSGAENKVEILKQKFLDLKNSLGLIGTEGEEQFKDIEQIIVSVGDKADLTEDDIKKISKALDDVTVSAQNVEDQAKDTFKSLGGSEDDAAELVQSGEAMGAHQFSADLPEELPEPKVEDFSSKIAIATEALGSLMSAYGAVNAVIETWNTLMDENATAMEKAGAVIGALTSITFAATSAMGLYKTLTESQIVANIKNTGTKLASAAATTSEGAAYGFLTTMVKGAQAAVGSFMASHPIGWILSITAAVVALGVAIANIDWRSEKEKYLDGLKKKSEALSKAQENLAQQIKDVESAWSNYQDMVSALDECTTGTEAWNQALLDCNQSVLTLLSMAPELAQFVQYGENGQITLGGIGYEDYITNLQQKNIKAQAIKTIAATDYSIQQLDLYGTDKNVVSALQTSFAQDNLVKALSNFGNGLKESEYDDIITAIFKAFGDNFENAIDFISDAGLVSHRNFAKDMYRIYSGESDYSSIEDYALKNRGATLSSIEDGNAVDPRTLLSQWSQNIALFDSYEAQQQASVHMLLGAQTGYNENYLTLYEDKLRAEIEMAMNDASKAYFSANKSTLEDLMEQTFGGAEGSYSEMTEQAMRFALATMDVTSSAEALSSIVNEVNDIAIHSTELGKELLSASGDVSKIGINTQISRTTSNNMPLPSKLVLSEDQSAVRSLNTKSREELVSKRTEAFNLKENLYTVWDDAVNQVNDFIVGNLEEGLNLDDLVIRDRQEKEQAIWDKYVEIYKDAGLIIPESLKTLGEDLSFDEAYAQAYEILKKTQAKLDGQISTLESDIADLDVEAENITEGIVKTYFEALGVSLEDFLKNNSNYTVNSLYTALGDLNPNSKLALDLQAAQYQKRYGNIFGEDASASDIISRGQELDSRDQLYTMLQGENHGLDLNDDVIFNYIRDLYGLAGETAEEVFGYLEAQVITAKNMAAQEWTSSLGDKYAINYNKEIGQFEGPGAELSSFQAAQAQNIDTTQMDIMGKLLAEVKGVTTEEAFDTFNDLVGTMIESSQDFDKVMTIVDQAREKMVSLGRQLTTEELEKILTDNETSAAALGITLDELTISLNGTVSAAMLAASAFDNLTSSLSAIKGNLKGLTKGTILDKDAWGEVKDSIPEGYEDLFLQTAEDGATFIGSEEQGQEIYKKALLESGIRYKTAIDGVEATRTAIMGEGNALSVDGTAISGSDLSLEDIQSWMLSHGGMAYEDSALESILKALGQENAYQEAIEAGLTTETDEGTQWSEAGNAIANAVLTVLSGKYTNPDEASQILATSGADRATVEQWNKEGLFTKDAHYQYAASEAIIDEYGKIGISSDEIQEQIKYLQEFADVSHLSQSELTELAASQIRFNRGVENGQDNMSDWIEELKNGEKSSRKYQEAQEGIIDTFGDILDLDWDKSAIKEFAESGENLELMEKALKGDTDALADLESQVAQIDLVEALDIETVPNQIVSVLDSISDIANSYDFGDIINIDSPDYGPIYAAFNELTAQAVDTGMGVEEAMIHAQNVLAGLDLSVPTPEYEWVTVDVNEKAPDGFIYSVTSAGSATDAMGNPIDLAQVSKVTTVPGPLLDGQISYLVNKGSGGGVKSTNKKVGSGGRRGGGGGGRGGGGGGSRRPTAEAKKEPDKERYHTITNQLEDLTDAYDKVSKAADRAFGKSRIKLLQDQRKELQKLAAAQQSYIDEINDYYRQDLSNLDQVSAYVGFDIQIDENGTITNFDEIQNRMWEEYNSHINEKGEVIDMDEEAWKKYEEEWQRIMDLITKYEETQDLRKEALQQLQDYINEIYDLQLEEVTYSVEIDIDASEYALEILDYLLKQVEDDAWSAAEAIAYMGEQATDFLHQSQTYNSGVADILRNHTRDITDSNGRVLKKATLTETDIQGYLNGNQASADKIRELGLRGEFTDEEIQSLKDYHSQLLAINQSLIDLRDQVYDTLLDSFSKFNEELQDTIDIMEHLTNITDSYRNIIDLVGKKNIDISNALLESFSQIQTNQAVDLVKAQKSRLDDLTTMRDEAEALRQKMLDEGNEKDAKEIEERIKEMNKQIREATEDYTSALENALQKAEDQFKLHIDNIIEDANQAFAGAMANIQQLQDMFNLKNDTNDIYLEDFEKIYELNKLNRDITNSIDETSNIKAKEELAKLQAEINALEEDGVKVSQYQTEDLRRRYELKLAEIALNEAQDAKSQVQMTRDADGNWSYVYTADENQVAEAEQNYEDKLYELQRANAEYINEMQDLLIQTETELMAKIEEITNDQTLSLEEKQALIDEFTAQYVEKFNGYAGELNLVLDNNKLLYEDEWTAYSNLTGYKISADENYVDSFNETMLSTLTGFQTAEEFHQNFNDTTNMLLNESDVAFEEWEDNVDEVFNAVGLSSEDLAVTLEEQFNNISNESENLAEDIKNTGDEAVKAFNDITEAVDNWYNQYSATIDRVLAQNTALAESFRTLLSAWSDYQAGSGVDDSGDDTGDEPPADGENPADEGTDVQDSVAEKTEKYKKAIAFAIWSHPNSGWGHGNSSKNLTSGDRYDRLKAKGLDPNTVQQQINAYRGKSTEYMKKDSGIDFNNWGDRVKALDPYTYKKFAFDTGGYTGSWGDEGRWALLHEKEIVLNKEDTSNLLSAISMIRQISEVIDLNAYSSAGFGSGIGAAASVGSTGTLEQVVHVTAEFPNATNKDEIYAAFGEIVNLASQYANRR